MSKSQLKQLKERLKANGFIGQTNTGKKQKKRLPASTRSDKDHALQAIREEFNPFEIKTTRLKHGDILGRKVQGATGKPGVSKQIGEDNRKRTLQRELERKNKVGAVVDRRFGENNPNMAPEEKMLERFTRERQMRSARSGSSLFNLEDDDDDIYGDSTLTHFGQALALEDDYDAAGDEEEEGSDDGGGFTRKRARESDDGSDAGDDDQERKKSKNEVMKEIIAKSKMYKHERQQAKDEDQDVIESLDGDMNDLRSLLFRSDAALKKASVAEAERDTTYDANVREMVFDRRAKPSDRTKTEEELAEEKATELKELENQRLRRMRGEVDDEDEDDKKRSRAGRMPQADDLSDDFLSDDAAEFGFGKGLENDFDEEEEDDEAGDDFNSEDEAGEESTEQETITVKARPGAKSSEKPLKVLEVIDRPSTEIAYTYKCPSDLEGLQEILQSHSLDNQLVIIDRIITLHHPSLKEGNKDKLMKLGPLLVQHAAQLVDNATDLSYGFQTEAFNNLVSKIHGMAKSYPEAMSAGFRDMLRDSRQRLQVAIDDRGTAEYPLPSDMFVFALIGNIFSTSDHFHLVATPAMLLMGQHLAQLTPKTLGDQASCTFLAALFLKYQGFSKRYIPEAINWLNLSLYGFVKAGVDAPQGFPLLGGTHKVEVEGSCKQIDTRNLTLADLKREQALIGISSAEDKQLALSILKVDLDTLRKFASLYKGAEAYKEIFTPALNLLDLLSSEITESKPRLSVLYPVLADITQTRDLLQKLIKFQTSTRRPLALQQHKPIPIPMNVPKFEENYSVDRKSYDPNLQRQEIGKLKAQLKKERKGALRELRKDNAFVAREKLKAKKKKDEEYHATLARLERSVGNEQ
ncbi:nucleolar protein 14 [Limtongia smithiae]|uniref:nucleolar protein 14 n=1 Tax=Limtongia smithiae TaxID=1125753 RepID=UPI0034CD134B